MMLIMTFVNATTEYCQNYNNEVLTELNIPVS